MQSRKCPRKRRFSSRIGSWVGCAVVFALVGCGDLGSSLSGTFGGRPMLVELEQVKYLHPASNTRMDSSSGGLVALGDINSDGFADFAIGASAQGRMAAIDLGWVEAYSGKDGTRLWQVSGKSPERAEADGDESSYHLGEITLLEDVNGDGAADIYCRRRPSGPMALLFSGRDGQRLAISNAPRSGYLQWPLFGRDINDDGELDVVFPAREDESFGVQTLSGVDLSPAIGWIHVWPAANARWTDWVLPRYADDDGDGVADCLLRRGLTQNNTDPDYTFEYAVLSGKDLSIIRTFESMRPRISGETQYGTADDLDGDTIPDVLMTSSTGDGADNHASSLRAFSGADGTILWKVLGTQMKGGRETQLVDVKTGETTHLQPDVEFKNLVLSVPDMNRDGIGDVATLAFAPGESRSQRAVLFFSGADGQPFEPLRLSEHGFRATGSMVLLDTATADGVPSLACSAKSKDGGLVIAVLPLPRSPNGD